MYRVKSEGEGEGDCEMMLQDQMDSPVADDVSSGGGSPHPHRGAGPPLKKGPWTSAEDAILVDYVKKHGEGNWNAVQKNTGLFRCGKSCRLRWANHLRPNLKKGAFTPEEERLIIQLHAKMGNKWARMAAHQQRRTGHAVLGPFPSSSSAPSTFPNRAHCLGFPVTPYSSASPPATRGGLAGDPRRPSARRCRDLSWLSKLIPGLLSLPCRPALAVNSLRGDLELGNGS